MEDEAIAWNPRREPWLGTNTQMPNCCIVTKPTPNMSTYYSPTALFKEYRVMFQFDVTAAAASRDKLDRSLHDYVGKFLGQCYDEVTM